jgi:hypothetical protein
MRDVFTRVAVGRARVVRDIRAAGPLAAVLRAPVPSRGPWQTAVLNTRRWSGLPLGVGRRPVAVVVEPHRQGRPAAVAFLELHRRGPLATVTLLGQEAPPVPGGRPAFRLLARDDAAAQRLAAGVLALLDGLAGAWTLRLAGLPLGDPTLRALAAELPAAVLANERSARLVDELDGPGVPPLRTRDPVVLERWLPGLLEREPDPHARRLLRAATRLHAAIGQVELAVVTDGAGDGRVGSLAGAAAERRPMRAALLTLVDGEDRWPWWGTSDTGALRTEMGAPLVTLTARGGLRPPPPPVGFRFPARPAATGRSTERRLPWALPRP